MLDSLKQKKNFQRIKMRIKTGDLVLSIDGLVAVKKVEKTEIVGTVVNLHPRMGKRGLHT